MPAEQPVLSYLRDLHAIRNTGAAVAETSYYPPLERLLNSVGRGLRPAVRCVMNLRNRGGGMPDGGLFTAEQLRRADDAEVFVAQLPTRGALEVKGAGDDLERIARSEQVGRYLARYGQVLVTNLRDFVLVAQGADGAALLLERYRLAANEAAFWSADPAELAAQHGEGLLAYLERVLLSNAPLADPRDLARFLASYARDARARIERAQVPALDALRRALEESLGIAFQGERGEHFFRSTLVQTLFYGVFSAWVLWCKEHRRPGDHFDWRSAAYFLRVPMIEALGRQVAALLDSETALDGVTQGSIRPELRGIAVISRVGGGALQPAAGELDVTANWGYGGRGGITMPGRGRADPRAPLAAEVAPEVAAAQLYRTAAGELRTYDVYLNNLAFWRNLPERVWEYTIGGYQVIKKWLSYRERDLLGRGLRPDEAREVTQIARRIAATLLLEPALDASYRAVTEVGG